MTPQPKPPHEGPAADLPFAGLKVVDIASWIAAPVAATILGDLGADVIKIEMPGEGDPYRQLAAGPAFEELAVNFPWIMDARCKRSLTLNLKHERGQEILHRLVADCDVYVTNQPLPMRRKLGLTWQALSPLNPRLIYASLTAYGEQGAERDGSSFDQVAYWARSGLCDLMRSPGAAPAQGLPGMGDHPTGVSLFAAIATALYRRERTGRGGQVETSLLANGLWSNGCLGQAALAGLDFSDRRAGLGNPKAPPPATHVLYETSDGRFLQLNMVRKPEHEEALLRVLGLEQLLEDEAFASQESRAENAARLADEMRPAIREQTLAHWLAALGAASVPASRVAWVEEIASDQQAIDNRVLLPCDDPEVGMPMVINHPIGLTGVEGRGAVRPPEVGEHTVELLTELGYDGQEIEEMQRQGVV